jgi:predicted nucleic acid-binding protein
MTAACFVDANILVYERDRANPLKREVAAQLLARLWREQSGRTSTQALNEFYVIVTRSLPSPLSPDTAWKSVERLMLWNPQCIDAPLMHAARGLESRYRISWWDALIVAAAKAQHCGTLYTEDLQHGAVLDGVRICNPFLAQVQEPAPPAYAPVRIAGHRPRGRPRKSAA